MFVVDTNVLVYAADSTSEAHPHCRKLLIDWRRQASPWYLTWGVVYEFLRVTTHPRVFRTPWTLAQAWEFLAAVLSSPAASILVEGEHHETILSRIGNDLPDLAGNIIHDLHTAALMQEHGVRTIYTRDTDFHRFPFVEVRDPLRT